MLNVERKMKCMVSTFLIMCFVCSGFAGISSPYSDTQTGTYGLWHLDSQSGGVIADDSGSDLLGRSNAANLVGGAAIVTPGVYPSGNSAFGDAVKLSAIGDYVEIDAGLNPYFNQENVRVEMWINMESSQANGNYCLANLDPFRFYVQAVDTSTGDYNLMLQVIQTDNTYGLTTTADLPDIAAAWTHVAFEYTADNDTGKLYVNGSLAAEQEGISEGIGLRSFRYRRFGTYSATGDTFIGMIDEIRVSSAVEPDTDVLAPYSDQAVGNAALLHMDSASGGFVDDDDSADLLARGNDGQLIGNAQIVTPGDYPAGNSAFGNAMSASAMGDYLEFPALIDEFSTNDGRIEAWIKLDSPVATGPHYIAMLNPYRFYINYGSGAYYLGLLLVKSNGAATAYYTVAIPQKCILTV
jgi:hypothetical protein